MEVKEPLRRLRAIALAASFAERKPSSRGRPMQGHRHETPSDKDLGLLCGVGLPLALDLAQAALEDEGSER